MTSALQNVMLFFKPAYSNASSLEERIRLQIELLKAAQRENVSLGEVYGTLGREFTQRLTRDYSFLRERTIATGELIQTLDSLTAALSDGDGQSRTGAAAGESQQLDTTEERYSMTGVMHVLRQTLKLRIGDNLMHALGVRVLGAEEPITDFWDSTIPGSTLEKLEQALSGFEFLQTNSLVYDTARPSGQVNQWLGQLAEKGELVKDLVVEMNRGNQGSPTRHFYVVAEGGYQTLVGLIRDASRESGAAITYTASEVDELLSTRGIGHNSPAIRIIKTGILGGVLDSYGVEVVNRLMEETRGYTNLNLDSLANQLRTDPNGIRTLLNLASKQPDRLVLELKGEKSWFKFYLVKEGITDERLTAKLEELRSKPPAAYAPTQAGS